MKRRTLIASGLGAAAGATLLGTASQAQSKDVIIATTAGLMERSLQEHFYRRFEQEQGIRVRSVPIELPDQWARAVAAGRSGGPAPFDIVTATPPDLIQHKDILLPIDCDKQETVKKNALPNSCFPHGLMRTGGGMVMVWNGKNFPAGKEPQSWADFFDTAKFPGPRTLPDTGDREWWVPVMALLADGVAADKLFPLDLDRAYRKLETLKPSVAAWWKSGDNSMQILRGGEAVMAMVYSSRAVPLTKSEGFNFTWNQAIRDVGNWAILKNAPNAANALAFLNFFTTTPAEHVPFSAKVSFDSNNAAAANLIPAEERRFRPSWPDNWSKLVVADYEWVATHRAAMRERWISWLTR